MKTTKMSLANMQGKLSRIEMKKIMAGSGTGKCGSNCGGDFGATCDDPACPKCNSKNGGPYVCS
jgi:hypothetical protein